MCTVVRTDGAGVDGKLSVVVRGRASQPAVELTRRQSVGHYDVRFTPTETGNHSISVLLSDLPVTGRLPFINFPTPQIVTLYNADVTYHFQFLTFGHSGAQS